MGICLLNIHKITTHKYIFNWSIYWQWVAKYKVTNIDTTVSLTHHIKHNLLLVSRIQKRKTSNQQVAAQCFNAIKLIHAEKGTRYMIKCYRAERDLAFSAIQPIVLALEVRFNQSCSSSWDADDVHSGSPKQESKKCFTSKGLSSESCGMYLPLEINSLTSFIFICRSYGNLRSSMT